MFDRFSTSATYFDRYKPKQTRENFGLEAPPYDDNTWEMLRYTERGTTPRDSYRIYKKHYHDEEIKEGGFARARCENYYQSLGKTASIANLASGVAVGGGIGALAANVLANSHVASKLGPFKKIAVPLFKKYVGKTTAAGAGIGALAGGLTGGMEKESSDDETHFYITDVGVSVLPKSVGPSELNHAFHATHPTAKYLPALGSILGGLGATAYAGMKKKPLPSQHLLAAITAGGALGTLEKLRQTQAFMNPYRADYVKHIEDKYNTKLANSPANEYITETNFEILPFANTVAPDLDAAYKMKHPMSNYVTALGTIAGVAGYMAMLLILN
jgi:hypothetical protein